MKLDYPDIKKLVKLSSFLDAIKVESEGVDILDDLILALTAGGGEVDIPGADEGEESEEYMAVFDLAGGDVSELEEKISSMPVDDLVDLLMEAHGKEELKELIESLKDSMD